MYICHSEIRRALMFDSFPEHISQKVKPEIPALLSETFINSETKKADYNDIW